MSEGGREPMAGVNVLNAARVLLATDVFRETLRCQQLIEGPRNVLWNAPIGIASLLTMNALW
jgi:hypothetical protein